MNDERSITVVGVKSCYGCGMCAAVCPTDAVKMSLSNRGFYVPKINKHKCIKCGMCSKVCINYKQTENRGNEQKELEGAAVWLKDKEMLRKSSSGGAIMAIAQMLVDKGYMLCGVKYNSQRLRAEHFCAESLEDFMPAVGSKYLQSLTYPAFKQAVDLKSKKWMVVGTPCQIAALRHLLRMTRQEKRFVLIDFWCHGVPSIFLWHRYIERISKQLRVVPNTLNAVWRDKSKGWHSSYKVVVLDKQHRFEDNSIVPDKNAFFRHFLRRNCANETCYTCPYEGLCSEADIRVGDFWGKKYKRNNAGVSRVIAFTENGKTVLRDLKEAGNANFQEMTKDDLTRFVDGQEKSKNQFFVGAFIWLLRFKNGLILAGCLDRACSILKRLKHIVTRVGYA